MSSKQKNGHQPRRSANRSLPPEAWRTLALLRDRELCRADWQRHLGDGFAVFAHFLEPLTGTVATTYPDPETGLPLTLRRVHDGTYTARPDDPDVTSATPIKGIPLGDVVRCKILWDKIGDAVAGALEIETHAIDGPLSTPWVCEIGLRRDRSCHRTALFIISADDEETLTWLRLLLKGGPLLIVLPFHDQLVESLTITHGHEYIALERDTTFKRTGAQWVLEKLEPQQPVKSTPPVAAFSAVQRVTIEGKFNFVVFPDGTRVDFRRSPKRRAFILFLLDHCEKTSNFDFTFKDINDKYERSNPAVYFDSPSMQFGLFRDFKYFGRFFDLIDSTTQEYRLLIRRR